MIAVLIPECFEDVLLRKKHKLCLTSKTLKFNSLHLVANTRSLSKGKFYKIQNLQEQKSHSNNGQTQYQTVLSIHPLSMNALHCRLENLYAVIFPTASHKLTNGEMFLQKNEKHEI